MADIAADAQLSDYWRVVSDLQSLATKVRVTIVVGTGADYIPSLFTGATTRSAQSNALDLIDAKLLELSENGRLGQQLVSGELDRAHWTAIANAEGAALNDLMRDAGSFTVGDFWSDVVVKTVTDIKAGAEDIAAKSPNYMMWAVVVLVLLVILQVTRIFL